MKKFKLLALILLFFLLLFVCSCSGGGSVGTGTGPRIEVQARVFNSESSAPIPDVSVLILETSETTITDSSGAFTLDIDATVVGDVITIILIGDTFEIRQEILVQTEGGSDTITTVSLNIFVNTVTEEVDVKEVQVVAKIVGTCDFYFDNTVPIRQSNDVGDNTTCTAKVTINDGASPVVGARFIVQVRACDSLSPSSGPWTEISSGNTGSNGAGQAVFSYSDSEELCVYRIVAPSGEEGFEEVKVEIHSFTFQARG